MIDRNKFQIGFEVECAMTSPKNTLRAKLDRIHPNIVIDYDYSVDNRVGEKPYELKTPPLKTDKALVVVDRVFKIVDTFGRTDSSTGFHVNISPVNVKEFDKFNPMYIAFHPLFKEITKAFGRQHCDYCLTNKMGKKFWQDLAHGLYTDYYGNRGKTVMYQEKDAAVNLEGLGYPSRTKRIEVRAFGGVNYHRKLPLIKHYIDEILKVFVKSIDFRFDYEKLAKT
jgi:hypothetical protein